MMCTHVYIYTRRELSHTTTSKYKDAAGEVRNDAVIKFHQSLTYVY
jgi:hypothetical protein